MLVDFLFIFSLCTIAFFFFFKEVGRQSFFKDILASSMVGFIASIVLFLIYSGIQKANLETEEICYRTYSLRALDANEDLNGNFSTAFFVGSGYIGEDLYYHFFYETANGIKYRKERAEGSYYPIYITENEGKPTFKLYGEFYKDQDNPYAHDRILHKTKMVLNIPKGTIKTKYKVN